MHPSFASGDVVLGETCVCAVNAVVAGPSSLPAHLSQWGDGPKGTPSVAQKRPRGDLRCIAIQRRAEQFPTDGFVQVMPSAWHASRLGAS